MAMAMAMAIVLLLAVAWMMAFAGRRRWGARADEEVMPIGCGKTSRWWHSSVQMCRAKLWPILRREAALGHVAPAYIVRMMVDALLDPGMLEKLQNSIDWKDLKGARTEHLQHLFASICQLIPAAGTNRYLPLEAPEGPRSYGVADPCSELCADVKAALKLLGTTSAADNKGGKGSKGSKGGKGKGEKSPGDESVSPTEKVKAEKSRRKQAKQARQEVYFRLQNVKCENLPGLARSSP
jgi:hypothetical protein